MIICLYIQHSRIHPKACVRDLVLAAYDLLVPTLTSMRIEISMGGGCTTLLIFDEENKRSTSGINTYIIWGVWKDCNMRVFEYPAASPRYGAPCEGRDRAEGYCITHDPRDPTMLRLQN
jgi:hypothetical protein